MVLSFRYALILLAQLSTGPGAALASTGLGDGKRRMTGGCIAIPLKHAAALVAGGPAGYQYWAITEQPSSPGAWPSGS
jgi:hypothetical protein